MKHTVHETLATAFESYSIVRQLRAVPPHEVYEVTVNGHHAVYKGNTGPTGKAAIEGRVTAFLGEQTSVPVPRIVRVGDDYFVAKWHPDAPPADARRDIDETWAFVAGRGLATLHAETNQFIDTYGQFQPQNGELTITGASDWHTAAIAYVRRHRSVPDQQGHADSVDTVIDVLTDRSELFEDADSPVCCHGWATPEHISVSDDQVNCIVDFEHALAAPGEFDYWRTVFPTFNHNTAALEQTFRDGYESIRSFPAGFERRKPLYLLMNLVYYFKSLYVQNQHGLEETAKRAKRFRKDISETVKRLS
ncbi:phosphotransferase [Halocatena halophila]|uniref:phosphotransferase n=1 Tax=Halocatena halophila TaxID=2814576 RepID=UPI002ED6C1BF